MTNSPPSVVGDEGALGSNDSIVRLFRDRDSRATQEVLHRVRRILVFRGYGIPREERRELEQEVMFQLWKAVRGPSFKESGFWGFVEVVASRRAIDWLRLRRAEISLDDSCDLADSRLTALEGLLDRERRDLARRALARLREPCRVLIGLVIGQGKTYREAAAVLGRSEGALRVQMHRCIGEARDLLVDTLRDRHEGVNDPE